MVRIRQPGPILIDCMKFTVLDGFVVNISRLNEECKRLKEKRNRRNDEDEVITIEEDDDVIVIEDEVIRIDSEEMTEIVEVDDDAIKLSDDNDDDDDVGNIERDVINDMVEVEDESIKVNDNELELIITDIRTVKEEEFSSDEVVSSKQNKVKEKKSVFKHKKLDLRRAVVTKEDETGITVNIYIE